MENVKGGVFDSLSVAGRITCQLNQREQFVLTHIYMTYTKEFLQTFQIVKKRNEQCLQNLCINNICL